MYPSWHPDQILVKLNTSTSILSLHRRSEEFAQTFENPHHLFAIVKLRHAMSG